MITARSRKLTAQTPSVTTLEEYAALGKVWGRRYSTVDRRPLQADTSYKRDEKKMENQALILLFLITPIQLLTLDAHSQYVLRTLKLHLSS